MKKHQHKRQSSFTLIELLVVMSIMATLMGILLPALSGARERGRRAVCLNNLSQIAIAMKTYSADYDEYLPPHFYSLAKHGTMPMIFVCPTAGTAPADSMAPSAFLRANCSYNLVVYKNAGTGG